MFFVLISQIFFACSVDHNDELIADNGEDLDGVFAAATIYYEKDGDKYAIVYHKNGERRDFNNGKKIGQSQETAPDPITIPEDIENPENVEIIENDAWTDEEAINATGGSSQSNGQLSAEVQYWKDKFDEEWTNSGNHLDSLDAHTRSKNKNLNADYYYLAYYIDALSSVWQATGDNKYLDEALVLINNTLNDAVDVGGGYKGWPSADGKEYALWDSYYWRHVITIVRIMHESPNLRNSKDYQAQYEKLLAFSEKNIWDRYVSYGVHNLYRSRTHMASHWARIGLELYTITGDPKYKNVFDNISFGEMHDFPSNLKEQLAAHPNNPNAIIWPSIWGATLPSGIQDTSHAGAIVSFMVLAHDQNMYWTKDIIDGLTVTLDEVIWKDSFGSNFTVNVDGSGGYEIPWRLHEWLTLGRYSQKIQDKIKNNYNSYDNLKSYGSQALGIAALNAKILEDGKGVYPEQ